MKTFLPKVNLDQRKWHVIDADGAILGRLAVQITNVLRGRTNPFIRLIWMPATSSSS